MLCLVALVGLGIGSASAQKKESASLKTTVFVTDLHCEQCAKKINNSIPFAKGVKDVKIDIPTKKVTVTYDATKTSDEGLVTAFKKIKGAAAGETPAGKR